ncbi:MAG: cystathionine gamma-synthase, partial [Eubacteriaceae bacterium]|nr:cystathionine gamma-synthase [Eubacteriaceae bacterium]
KKQSRGFGAIITFLVNDKTFAQEVLENIKIIQFAESLGGVETLMTYPITQTHADLSPELLEKNGITEKVLRLSVGIEAADDLIGDLQAAFIKAEEKLHERKKY